MLMRICMKFIITATARSFMDKIDHLRKRRETGGRPSKIIRRPARGLAYQYSGSSDTLFAYPFPLERLPLRPFLRYDIGVFIRADCSVETQRICGADNLEPYPERIWSKILLGTFLERAEPQPLHDNLCINLPNLKLNIVKFFLS